MTVEQNVYCCVEKPVRLGSRDAGGRETTITTTNDDCTCQTSRAHGPTFCPAAWTHGPLRWEARPCHGTPSSRTPLSIRRSASLADISVSMRKASRRMSSRAAGRAHTPCRFRRPESGAVSEASRPSGGWIVSRRTPRSTGSGNASISGAKGGHLGVTPTTRRLLEELANCEVRAESPHRKHQ